MQALFSEDEGRMTEGEVTKAGVVGGIDRDDESVLRSGGAVDGEGRHRTRFAVGCLGNGSFFKELLQRG